MIETFGSSSALPNIISAENFDQYFTVDTGIANCSNHSGCPTDATSYITAPGVIVWQNGKSATFRTKNPVLPSGEGFVGFKLNSVPMGQNVWNSIWLMGKNAGRAGCGPCLEIDIYELMNQWWKETPKISFHDWPSGLGAEPKSEQGCFGIYLNGKVGDGGCNPAYGKVVKNWDWNSAQSQIYKGASWYTLVTKDSNNKPLVYVGISLKGWLPQSQSEATYANVLANSDFIVSSGAGNIKGDPTGGFWFCLTSTTSGGNVSGEWNIPNIVNYDGASSGGTTPTPPTGHSKPTMYTQPLTPSPSPNPDDPNHIHPNPSQPGHVHNDPSNPHLNIPRHVHTQSTSPTDPSHPTDNSNTSNPKHPSNLPVQTLPKTGPTNNNISGTSTGTGNSGALLSDCYSKTCKINKDASDVGEVGKMVTPGNISFNDCLSKCNADPQCNYFKSGPGEWCELFSDNKFPNAAAWNNFVKSNAPDFKSATGDETYYTALPSKLCCNK